MAIPRAKLVDDNQAFAYHLVSNCVRSNFLCGRDQATGKDYSHRKAWIQKRIQSLAKHFAVDVYAYAVMSNHFHLVVLYDPNASSAWTAEEVASRWTSLCPVKKRNGTIDVDATDRLNSHLLQEPEELERKRAVLGSLSHFMKFLKQPIAARANREDNCRGHFFDQRFYSGILLDSQAFVNAMVYVDLNPVRARLSESKASSFTSLPQQLNQLKHRDRRGDLALMPIVSGLNGDAAGGRPGLSLRSYVLRVEACARAYLSQSPSTNERKWLSTLRLFTNRQRAYGNEAVISGWFQPRGFKRYEQAVADLVGYG